MNKICFFIETIICGPLLFVALFLRQIIKPFPTHLSAFEYTKKRIIKAHKRTKINHNVI